MFAVNWNGCMSTFPKTWFPIPNCFSHLLIKSFPSHIGRVVNCGPKTSSKMFSSIRYSSFLYIFGLQDVRILINGPDWDPIVWGRQRSWWGWKFGFFTETFGVQLSTKRLEHRFPCARGKNKKIRVRWETSRAFEWCFGSAESLAESPVRNKNWHKARKATGKQLESQRQLHVKVELKFRLNYHQEDRATWFRSGADERASRLSQDVKGMRKEFLNVQKHSPKVQDNLCKTHNEVELLEKLIQDPPEVKPATPPHSQEFLRYDLSYTFIHLL